MNKWTTEQETAIEERKKDILVSAAAGSGKTAVLVERIIRIITDKEKPVDIDRLLVLTFTKAAASEMRERISARLLSLLKDDPKDINLKNQLTLLNRAQITTIHAFCMDVVKKNYAAINVDPAFRVADEAETAIIENDVLDELFEKKYEENDEDFLGLVESFDNGFKDSGLRKMLLDIYKFVRSTPFPKKWIDEMVERYNFKGDFEDGFFGKLIKEEIAMRLDWAKDNVLTAISITQKPYGPQEYFMALQIDIDGIAVLEKALEKGLADFEKAYYEYEYEALSRKKKDTDAVLADAVKKLREKEKSNITEIGKQVLIKDLKLIEEDVIKSYPFLKALGELVKEYDELFGLAKAKKQIMDFNDLEQFCLKVLVKEDACGDFVITDCARSYREKFYEIITDEYQDSNLIQELVLSAVSKGANRFMVGDVKQSIYRFRMARPEIFMEKYNTFSLKDGEKIRIDLFKNFRSRKNILDGINFIFERIMSPSLGEIEYDEGARLEAGAEFKEGPDDSIVLDILLKDSIKAYAEENEYDFEVSEIEARHIALRIKELIAQGYMVTEKSDGSLRKATYGDIVILMRATNTTTEVFSSVFEQEGIPLKTDTSSGFFNTTEIMTVVNFLSIIDNPRQDIPLISVLYSPIYALNATELMNIKLIGKKDFYECAIEYCKIGEDEGIKSVLNEFFDDLESFRNEAGHISIADLILKIYNDTGYFNMAGMMEDGSLRQANLRLLINKAENYENSNFNGLFNFIKYIERLKVKGIDMGEAKTSVEKTAVSLMTIHKSKGLEFPIVFVAGLGRKFNKRDITQNVLMHQSLGFGTKRFDYKNRVVYETAERKLIGQRIEREGLSEEVRVLYVALTRARDKLFLVGSVDDIKKRVSDWGAYLFFEEIPYHNLLNEISFLNWIAPCIMRHRDGQVLRDMLDVDDYMLGCGIIDDESRWEVNIIGSIADGDAEEQTEDIVDAEADDKIKAEIKENLRWEYGFKDSIGMPANVSISEIKRIYQDRYEAESDETRFKESSGFEYIGFDEKKGISSARRGTIMHTVMEHIDFSADVSAEYIKDLLLRLVDKNIISEEEADTVKIKKVLAFFKNDIFNRIRNAKAVCKEEPFVMTLKSNEVFDQVFGNSDEDILIHGIIDCYFEEDDGLVLLDYKTDFVTSEEEIRNRYKIQLDMYKQALEKATGKRVKNVYIYLFGTDSILDMG